MVLVQLGLDPTGPQVRRLPTHLLGSLIRQLFPVHHDDGPSPVGAPVDGRTEGHGLAGTGRVDHQRAPHTLALSAVDRLQGTDLIWPQFQFHQ
jgi:hypothetical protein